MVESSEAKGGEVFMDISNQFTVYHPLFVTPILHVKDCPPIIEVECVTCSMFLQGVYG